jgi:hypothetical protein
MDALTPLQREAVVATATAFLVDPEALAGEWLHLLEERPVRVPTEIALPVVKGALTADAREGDCI